MNVDEPIQRPANYSIIVYWVQGLASVNHSQLEMKYNLRYKESRNIIKALQADGYITERYDIKLNGYKVISP